MKKFLVFATLFFLCLALGFSALATDVGGIIDKDTTWAKAGSPFIVKSHVTVIEDVTLTIEPSVIVKFDKDKALLIDGTIVAKGTEAEKIIFTSNGDQVAGYWGWISFSDTSEDATFDPSGNYTGGCIIQFADIKWGGSAKPVVTINLSSPFIADSLIANNYGNGVSIAKGSPVIRNCQIKNNSGSGVYYSGDLSTNPIIQDCVISGNSNSGISLGSGALTIQNSTISGSYYGIYVGSGTTTIQNSTTSGNYYGIYVGSGTTTIQNSTISGNYYGGIYLGSSTTTIQNSTISGNSGYGIFASGSTTIQNSTISENSGFYGGGIYTYYGSTTIQNSIISGNSASYGGGIYTYSGTVTIQGNMIIGNTASISFGGVVRLENLSGGSVVGGTSCQDANLIKDNNGDAVYISGSPAFNYNDVYNNTGFELINGSSATFDASNCYWGTTKEAVVKAEIWDGLDDPALGLVTYKPFSLTPCRPDDTTPPAAVTNLTTSSPTANSITLTWTAPGDDGNVGQATTYDIRYSMAEITEENWDAATPCEGEPLPKPAGEPETFTVPDLSPCTTYYFALKTADEVPNWSELSNVPTGKTSGDVGAINGHVTDTVGNPIAKAIVIAIKKPAKMPPVFTDASGYFEIKDLQVGIWQVICIKKGYKAGIKKVEVKACETTTVDFKLSPSAGDDEDEFTDLYANYPNPFNPDTWIPYSLSPDSDVTIRIYNSAGRLVRTLNLGRQVAGIYMDKDKAAYWDGKDDLGQQVASGVYYYTLRAGDFSATRKMVILK
ncbi:T9SS type A sorting domain-containing protein [Candidatus Poribacteria bacterium]|nr:T9SS type A sorting domain-containing protein [Candidatus Poribacteria bacterium]